MRLPLAWALVLGLASCATPPSSTRPTPPGSQVPSHATSTAASELFIKLDRGSCFGSCPVYELTISSSGLVSFHGKEFVARLGQHTRQLTPAQMDALRAATATARFFEVKSQRRLTIISDSPTLDLTINEGGQTRHIRVDVGSAEWWPPAVSHLGDVIDDIADSGEWIVARPDVAPQ